MAFPDGWGRQRLLELNPAAGTSETGWTLYLNEANIGQEADGPLDADGSYPALNGGGDLRFSTDEAGTSQIACHVQDFTTNNDPASATAEVYVEIPTLTPTTEIWMWWNKAGETQPAAAAAYGQHATYDASHQGVYHCEDTGSPISQLTDATGNANHLTNVVNTPNYAAGGILGKGHVYFDTSESVNKSAAIITDYPLTLECIFDRVGTATRGFCGLSQSTAGNYAYVLGSTSNLNYCKSFGTNDAVLATASGGTSWYTHHYARSGSSTDHSVASNGGTEGTSSTTANLPALNRTTVSGWYRGSSTLYYTCVGNMDEVRFHSVKRSIEWMRANYLNMFSPATFTTTGTPQTPAAGGFAGSNVILGGGII